MDSFKKWKNKKIDQKNSANFETGEWIIVVDDANEDFVGYETYQVKTRISRYRIIENKKKIKYQIVLDKTPFYAESGGQVGDNGILDYNGNKIEIIDVKKENNLIYHITENLPKDLNESCEAKINIERRQSISRNHSATHLLHYQLRKNLEIM